MATCKLSPQEFIKDTFTPQVAVMCTPTAQKCCEKNNLDFTEVLQPFSRLTSDVAYKDTVGLITTVRNLKVTFLDVTLKPLQPTLARKLLNASVSETLKPRMKMQKVGNYQYETPTSTPWFERWRDTFLKVQYPSDHEFTKHFLACLLVVSSSDKNPVETMNQLSQNLNQIQSETVPGKMPKWFSTNILKYYVILHDNVDGDFPVASESFESLKTLNGVPNCFLLRINSRPAGLNSVEHLADPWSQFLNKRINSYNYQNSSDNSPDQKMHVSLEIGLEANEIRNLNYHPLSPEVEDIMDDLDLDKEELKDVEKWSHGSCLSVDDIEQIKTMICEFVKMCLLPYVEKQLEILSDSVANKKGMSKSLFSATKRWFSATKPTGGNAAVNNLVYAVDSPELQIRRLGDLYFMFGNYSAAFQAYHTAKRDFNADQAWLYYAGALEMAALSAFMNNESSRKTYDYMEESIITYLTTCKLPQFATRATLLSSECLKSKQLYGETALQLIRMTSEDSDLRSALLLEQASYCFMHSSMLRKYAFHMVLSGHRFSKAAQKIHSLRCYKQAYQIYENTGWDLASDHIHYTIGRLSNNLQIFDEAVTSFAKLLSGESKQSATQQGIFLREYLTVLETKLTKDETNDRPILPVPQLNNALVKVLVGPTRPLSTPGKIPALGIQFSSSKDQDSEHRWHKLEEMLLSEETGVSPLVFKPMVTLYTACTMETSTVLAIINEPIQVSVQLVNPLQTGLLLKDLHLLWSYEHDAKIVTNLELDDEAEKFVKTYVIKSLVIQGNSSEDLILSLTPLATGNIKISAVCYTLTGCNTTTDCIYAKGKKLLNVSSDCNVVKSIYVKVVPHAPCLQMSFSEINMNFLAGELQRVLVNLQNTGSVPVKNIMIATSVPHLVSNCELKINQVEFLVNREESSQMKDKLARKNHITAIPLDGNKLDSGQCISFHIWVMGPHNKGPCSIDLLTYYENIDSKSIPKYRLIRHSWSLNVQESLSIEVSTQGSYNFSTTEDLALALKTTNLNKIQNSISTEITLLNIVLLSNNWILTKDIVTPNYINLNSQESAHILVKARRNVYRDTQYSSISLSSGKGAPANLPTAFQTFAKKCHMPLLNAFVPNSENKKRDGTLILEWNALVCDSSRRRFVNGHGCIPIQVTRKEQQLNKLIANSIIDLNNSSMDNENYNSDDPHNQVIYKLLYPSVVKHNFQKTNSCVVFVTLVLHNIVQNAVTVTVNTLDISSKMSSQINKPSIVSTQATSSFCWVRNGKIIRTLKPLTSTTVNLSVIVTHPGTFDIGNNLCVFCRTLDDEQNLVLQLYEVCSLLMVIDSNIN